MAFIFDDDLAVPQGATETDTVRQHPLGTYRWARDNVSGVRALLVYLQGVASTVVGDAVVYTHAGLTTRIVATSRGPAAVALSANVANQYGWYVVLGTTPVRAATVAANTPAFASATAGTLDDAVSATNKVDGLIFTSTDAGGFASAVLHFPAMNGNG